MRFFILLFLLGVAFANPVYDALQDEVDFLAHLDSSTLEEYLTFATDEGDDEIKTELGKKLQEHLDDIITKIRDAIDQGKEVKQSLLDRLEEVKGKLKDLKIKIKENLQEKLEKLKDKVKEYWDRILDIFKENKDKQERDTEAIETDFGTKMREAYEKLIEKMREGIEKGKEIKEENLEKLRDLGKKLKEMKVKISERTKELLQNLKEKTKELWENMKDSTDKLKDKLKDKAKELLDLLLGKEKRNAAETEMGKQLKEALDQLLEHIKEHVDHGRKVKDETIEKVKEIIEKLKDLKVDIGEKAKELVNKIKEKAKELIERFKKIFEFKEKEKRVIQTLRDMLKKMKDAILKKFDKEALKEIVEKVFGKGSELAERLLEILKEKGEKGKQHLLDLIDRILGEKETVEEKRSIKDLWERVKNYFDELKIQIKEKYLKFGEWVREKIGKGLEKAKDHHEKIKKIAEEFINHSKEVGKDIAAEALDFLRPYKEDLGSLWEQVKKTAKDVLNREN